MIMVRALICDDSALFRKQLAEILHDAGTLEVIEASNGIDAIRSFKQYEPDFVFIDVIMTRIDGIATLKELLRQNNDAHIFMTSSCSRQDDLNEAIRLGADDFVQKPVNKDNILPLLEKYSPAPS